MRTQFVKTLSILIEADPRLVLLLGDLSVYGFRNVLDQFPDRVINIGILEQATVGVAAGMAMSGFIPVFHSIAPFIVERAYEQLKLDFGYQQLGGNFVSVGASYDYAALGSTHHCPGDVALLKQIPSMEVFVPGNAQEFDLLFNKCYANDCASYFRLSEQSHQISDLNINPYKLCRVTKTKNVPTIVVVGPLLDLVIQAVEEGNFDCNILYCTTAQPFDTQTLYANCPRRKILLVEPFYEGTLAYDIIRTFPNEAIQLECVGVPYKFITDYGTALEQDIMCGFTINNINEKFKRLGQ